MTRWIASWVALLSLLGGCCGHLEPQDIDVDVGGEELAAAGVTDIGVFTDGRCTDVCARVTGAGTSQVGNCSLTVEPPDTASDSDDTGAGAQLSGHLTCTATLLANCS